MALITAGLAYLLVSDTGTRAADEDLTQIAVGRTVGLADEIGNRRPRAASTTLAGITAEGYSAWVFDADGRLATPSASHGVDLLEVPGARGAVRSVADRQPLHRRHRRRGDGGRGADLPQRRDRRRDPRPVGARARGPAGDRGAARRPADGARRRGRGRGPRLVPDRERDHDPGQAPGRERSADQRGRARRTARWHRRSGRDHRPRPGAGDDARRAAPDVQRPAGGARPTVGDLRGALRRRPGGPARRRGALLQRRRPRARRPGRTGDRPADSLAATGLAPRGGRERRAAGRQPRLLAQRPRAAGRGRGSGRGPKPHRGAAARGRRARVRVQRGARAAQSDRGHLRGDRGPAGGRQGRPGGARALPSPARRRTRSGSAA